MMFERIYTLFHKPFLLFLCSTSATVPGEYIECCITIYLCLLQAEHFCFEWRSWIFYMELMSSVLLDWVWEGHSKYLQLALVLAFSVMNPVGSDSNHDNQGGSLRERGEGRTKCQRVWHLKLEGGSDFNWNFIKMPHWQCFNNQVYCTFCPASDLIELSS